MKQPVVVPGSAGAAATVAFLPLETDTPVELIDGHGNAIGEWAGRPTGVGVDVLHAAFQRRLSPDQLACGVGRR